MSFVLFTICYNYNFHIVCGNSNLLESIKIINVNSIFCVISVNLNEGLNNGDNLMTFCGQLII